MVQRSGPSWAAASATDLQVLVAEKVLPAVRKIKVDINKIPDWGRRATRLGMAIIFFGMLGHCILWPPEQKELGTNFRQSMNWAAITCIVVTAPVIGKVAQVAFDRLLGTAAGGLIGFLAFFAGYHALGLYGAGVFISLFGGTVVVPLTVYAAYKHNLDQLARFVQLTYCIVAFGAKPDKGAHLLALLRVGGIFAGGVFSVVLAVLVLPRSASVEALREMKKAMKVLLDLNKEVWAFGGIAKEPQAAQKQRTRKHHHRHGYSALGLADFLAQGAPSDAPLARGGGGGSLTRRSMPADADPSMDHLQLLVQQDEEMDAREAEIEKLFASLVTALGKVEEALGQAKGEVYIWHFWGHYFFLPAIHWFPVSSRWQVPTKDLQRLATCMRRVARLLWALLLDFEEGFEPAMREQLAHLYPKQLFSEMAITQQKALADLLVAFPNSTSIEIDNLFTLGQVVDCLMIISDARSREAVFNEKGRRRQGTRGARRDRSESQVPPADASAAAAAGDASEAGSALGDSRVPDGGKQQKQDSATLELQPLLQPGQGQGKPSDAQQPRTASGSYPTAAATVNGAAATAAIADVDEKAPLLQVAHFNSSGGAGGGGDRGPAHTNGGLHADAVRPADPRVSTSEFGMASTTLTITPGQRVSSAGGAAAASSSGDASGGIRGRSSGGGMFVSRLLSGGPSGEPALLAELPRRRQLFAQAQQQQALEAASSQATTLEGKDSIDILNGFAFQQLSDAPSACLHPTAQQQQPAAPAPAPASALSHPQLRSRERQGLATIRSEHSLLDLEGQTDGSALAALRRQYGSTYADGDTAGAAGSSVPAAQPSPSPFVSLAQQRLSMDQRSTGTSTGPSPSPTPPLSGRASLDAQASLHELPSLAQGANSAAGQGTPAAAATTESPSLQATGQPHSSGGRKISGGGGERQGGVAAPAAASAAAVAQRAGSHAAWTLGRRPTISLADAFARASTLGSSGLLVEPVVFPPTEEGYISQVRWYSFQFVMDEMVEELEEAFHACAAVLRQLPYPIGN